MRLLRQALIGTLLVGFASAQAHAAAKITCDVEADHFQDYLMRADPPAISGSLRALEFRANKYWPVANVWFLSKDKSEMAGLRLRRDGEDGELMVVAIIGQVKDVPPTEYILGNLALDQQLDFSIVVKDGHTLVIDANEYHFEDEFPAEEVGDIQLSCSTGKFAFTNLKTGKSAILHD